MIEGKGNMFDLGRTSQTTDGAFGHKEDAVDIAGLDSIVSELTDTDGNQIVAAVRNGLIC